jgi:hypothetical protein
MSPSARNREGYGGIGDVEGEGEECTSGSTDLDV